MFSPVELADLIAVHDTGSMTKAAAMNGRTKPAVSQAFSRLERTAGFQILERPSWNVKFTEQGEVLVARARIVMAELDALSSLADTLATGVEPQITLAVDHAIPGGLWMPLSEGMATTFPKTKLEILALDGSEVARMLAAKTIQAAVVVSDALRGADESSIESIACKEIEFVDVVRLGKPFHGEFRPLSLPEVIVADDRHFKACSHLPPCIHVSDRTMQISLIEDGFGWGCVPTHMVSEKLDEGQLIQLPKISENSHSSRITICRPTGNVGPASKLIWEELIRLCG